MILHTTLRAVAQAAHMMTSSNGNIFRVTGPLRGEFTGPGEFPTQRPVMRSFDVSFDLRLNKRLSKQMCGWWFETPSWSLWRQCNDVSKYKPQRDTPLSSQVGCWEYFGWILEKINHIFNSWWYTHSSIHLNAPSIARTSSNATRVYRSWSVVARPLWLPGC